MLNPHLKRSTCIIRKESLLWKRNSLYSSRRRTVRTSSPSNSRPGLPTCSEEQPEKSFPSSSSPERFPTPEFPESSYRPLSSSGSGTVLFSFFLSLFSYFFHSFSHLLFFSLIFTFLLIYQTSFINFNSPWYFFILLLFFIFLIFETCLIFETWELLDLWDWLRTRILHRHVDGFITYYGKNIDKNMQVRWEIWGGFFF